MHHKIGSTFRKALGLIAPQADQALNVSYEPACDLHHDYRQVFAAQWEAKTDETLKLRHALAVVDGLNAVWL